MLESLYQKIKIENDADKHRLQEWMDDSPICLKYISQLEPYNYYERFFPFMDVIQAEEYLSQSKELFILRLSSTHKKNLTITFKQIDGKIYHTRIDLSCEDKGIQSGKLNDSNLGHFIQTFTTALMVRHSGLRFF